MEFRGYPSDDKTIEKIVLKDILVEGAAQAGTVFMGCSNISVKNYTVKNTLADGIHFNACRHIHAEDITGVNTGDDTLAIVTYTGPTVGKGPFAIPKLGEWCDNDTKATNISSTDSHSNGCRITGDMDVTVSNLTVVNATGAGIEIDSTVANGTTYKYTSCSSRGVAVDGVNVTGCKHAVLVHVGNPADMTDPAYWHFDGYVKHVVAHGTRSKAISITAGASGLAVDPIK